MATSILDQTLDRAEQYDHNVYYLCTKLSGMDKETTMGILDMHKYFFDKHPSQKAIDLTIETLEDMKNLTEEQLQQLLDTWADDGIDAAIKLKNEMMDNKTDEQ